VLGGVGRLGLDARGGLVEGGVGGHGCAGLEMGCVGWLDGSGLILGGGMLGNGRFGAGGGLEPGEGRGLNGGGGGGLRSQ